MRRLIYKQLVDWKNSKNKKPLILKGARQTGKTYILKEFGKQEFKRTFYINFMVDRKAHSIFEDAQNISSLLEELQHFFKADLNLDSDLLIFDEIQECPRALSLLKIFYEQTPRLSIACAGSHMGLVFTSQSFPVGTITYLQIHPMNFEEFLMSKNDPALLSKYRQIKNGMEISELFHTELIKELKYYLLTGGLPEIVKLSRKSELTRDKFREIRQLQNTLIDSYISDFAKHSGKVNAGHINRVFQSVPRNIGATKDGSLKKYVFKNVIPGKKGYRDFESPINWLISTGLVIPVYIVNRIDSNLMAFSKDNYFKLYLFDIGLLGAFFDLDLEEIMSFNFGISKGAYTENFVAQQLRSEGWMNLYSWAENTSEIEFVVKKENEIIPIEVKSSERFRARSFEFYSKRYQPKTAYIVSMNRPDFSNKTVLRLPLYCPMI